MTIMDRLAALRIEFFRVHDRSPHVARLPPDAMTELRERFTVDGDFAPIDGRVVLGLILVDDPSASTVTLE